MTVSQTALLSFVAGATNRLSQRNISLPSLRRASRRRSGKLRFKGRRGRTNALIRFARPTADIKSLTSTRFVATCLDPTTHRSAKYLGGRYQWAEALAQIRMERKRLSAKIPAVCIRRRLLGMTRGKHLDFSRTRQPNYHHLIQKTRQFQISRASAGLSLRSRRRQAS